jgi:hypothetical protein
VCVCGCVCGCVCVCVCAPKAYKSCIYLTNNIMTVCIYIYIYILSKVFPQRVPECVPTKSSIPRAEGRGLIKFSDGQRIREFSWSGNPTRRKFYSVRVNGGIRFPNSKFLVIRTRRSPHKFLNSTRGNQTNAQIIQLPYPSPVD